jgi:hypothetical protein
VSIVSTVTNACTWSARTLTYTGNKIGTGVWTAASSMSFEFDLTGYVISSISTLHYSIDIDYDIETVETENT